MLRFPVEFSYNMCSECEGLCAVDVFIEGKGKREPDLVIVPVGLTKLKLLPSDCTLIVEISHTTWQVCAHSTERAQSQMCVVLLSRFAGLSRVL